MLQRLIWHMAKKESLNISGHWTSCLLHLSQGFITSTTKDTRDGFLCKHTTKIQNTFIFILDILDVSGGDMDPP